MKKLIVPVLVMLAMAVYAQDEMGDEDAAPAKPAAVEIKGQVSVAKDEAGAVKEVKITAADKAVYIVKQDAEGKKVAALDGKNVVAKGIVDAKTKTITVQKCEEVKEEVED